MANITKTIIYPIPTEWMKDTQDDTNVGVATYYGPEKLITEWIEGTGDESKRLFDVFDPDDKQRAERPTPVGIVTALLDVNVEPLHALTYWGQKFPPLHIEVNVGPSWEPNPTIADPSDFTEVFDMESFYYDQYDNTWSTPIFSWDGPGVDKLGVSTEGVCFGWDHVRMVRNTMLSASDGRVAASDMPDATKQPWLDYRTKLRNLPTDWAGVGTATHLIVWPLDPDQLGMGITTGERPNNGITD